MHAASVHPEPGSNSRTNCISTVSGQHQVCRACDSFYFLSMHPVLSGCVSKNDEIFALASFLLVLKSPVVQLSMINRGSDSVLAFPPSVSPRLSRGQLIYYTTFASTCQEVFKTFFKKSFEPAVREAFARPLPQGLLIISHFLPLVKGVVKIFLRGLTGWLPVCLPSACFSAPIPPTPVPSGEGGDYKLVLPGASPPAPPAAVPVRHRRWEGGSDTPAGA